MALSSLAQRKAVGRGMPERRNSSTARAAASASMGQSSSSAAVQQPPTLHQPDKERTAAPRGPAARRSSSL